MLSIHQEMNRCNQIGINGVIGTIIETEGSTYQKVGAKCFFAEDGKLTGLLSGGCVEKDLMEYTKEIVQTGRSKKIFYDFRGEEDQLWGLGVGCNGAITIFLEPYILGQQPIQANIINQLATQGLHESRMIITIVEAAEQSLIGDKWILACATDDHSIPFEEIRREVVRRRINQEKGISCLMTKFGEIEVFFDFENPPPKLVVFGAGPDAVPIMNGASQLGWHTTIVDHRHENVNTIHFPNANQLICRSLYEWSDQYIDEFTYAIIMSHHFEQDQFILENVLRSNAAYLGILGPTVRTKKLLSSIYEDSKVADAHFKRLHSPIGLSIGAVTPEEIALSILAEIVKVFRDNGDTLKSGAFPREMAVR